MTSVSQSIDHVTLELLHAELSRRQQDGEKPECGSGKPPANYNTPLHVIAVLIILVLSTFACSFPLVARRYPRLPIPNRTLFLSRHFGTGVLTATAFVHLLPTAYTSLTDPCLPRFWNEVYPAMAGFTAMVSVFVVVGIEMFFATKGAAHSHGIDFELLREDGQGTERRPSMGGRRSGSFKPFRQAHIGAGVEDEVPLQTQQPAHRSPYSDSPGDVDKPLPPPPPPEARSDEDEDEVGSDLELDELDADMDDTQPLTGSASFKNASAMANGHTRPKPPSRNVSFASPISSPIPQTPGSPDTTAHDQKQILQCLLLEAGILFHSIFIGMALSVSTGPAFIVLLIAISFHQTFEGLALGSRIAAIPAFSTSSWRPWAMSAMYGVTTPIGQVIGLAVHTLYDPASQFGLLMVGIVNAVSAGLLLYAGLVQLIAEDFLSDHSYHELQGRRRLEASGAVVCGSILMALVGAFA